MLRNRQAKTRLGRLRELSYISFDNLHKAIKLKLDRRRIEHLSDYDCQFYSEKHFDWVMQERRKEWEAAESLKIDGPEPLEERDFND